MWTRHKKQAEIELGQAVILSPQPACSYPLHPVALALGDEIVVACQHPLPGSELEPANDNIPRFTLTLSRSNLHLVSHSLIYRGAQQPYNLALATASGRLHAVWNAYSYKDVILTYLLDTASQSVRRLEPALYLPSFATAGDRLYLLGHQNDALAYLSGTDGQHWADPYPLEQLEDRHQLDFARPQMYAAGELLAATWGLLPRGDGVALAERRYRRRYQTALRGGRIFVRWYDGVGWRRAQQVNAPTLPAAYPALTYWQDRLWLAYCGWEQEGELPGLYLASRTLAQAGWASRKLADFASTRLVEGGAVRSHLLPLSDPPGLLLVALQGGNLHAYLIAADGECVASAELTSVGRSSDPSLLLVGGQPFVVWQTEEPPGSYQVVAAPLRFHL